MLFKGLLLPQNVGNGNKFCCSGFTQSKMGSLMLIGCFSLLFMSFYDKKRSKTMCVFFWINGKTEFFPNLAMPEMF